MRLVCVSFSRKMDDFSTADSGAFNCMSSGCCLSMGFLLINSKESVPRISALDFVPKSIFGVINGLGNDFSKCLFEFGSMSVLCSGNGDKPIGDENSSVRRSIPMRFLPDLIDGMNFDGVTG